MKPELTNTELKILLDTKLNEDIIFPLFINGGLVELHKPDINGYYKIRMSDLSIRDFKNQIDNEFTIMSDWILIDKKVLFNVMNDARGYIEDVFFNFS